VTENLDELVEVAAKAFYDAQMEILEQRQLSRRHPEGRRAWEECHPRFQEEQRAMVRRILGAVGESGGLRELMEGVRELDWCKEHRCEVRPPGSSRCSLGQWMDEYAGGEPPCNMVPAKLWVGS
jgi:hypothetical protein